MGNKANCKVQFGKDNSRKEKRSMKRARFFSRAIFRLKIPFSHD